MIGYIKGIVADLEENQILLENNGIGYEILMPASALERSLREGMECRIYTYLQVKEDGLQLFGFLTKDDLQVFRQLLTVSGIGPKAALGILSGLSADELRFAVLADDAATIARKSPGVGKKTAQKLILELKDKFDLQEAFEKKLEHQAAPAAQEAGSDVRSEAVQALVALGYSSTEALRAVKQADDGAAADAEELLKASLKRLI
ncbi:MAG TPA: Holliday junction branch migration protein RuvA [Candidatus Egerieimonas intestinavium]|uniref:Holliday junction branch migration complex subunit RuvA n=1 Tax=Candidatus Egerieimonas intestinavium TaxID=2840777 RepID=A0A9D1JGI5_9FIRM|nr:Holliday junction branch migration protein RuvA [Candidatus Egerieimonas intestinavium]